MCTPSPSPINPIAHYKPLHKHNSTDITNVYSIQVNIPAESGDMGVLASHVPSIEQLKPGLVEIIEESAGSKQFFRTSSYRT